MEQCVGALGELIEEGRDAPMQGVPVASQAMQAQHVVAQPAPQLLMAPMLMHLLLSNTDK